METGNIFSRLLTIYGTALILMFFSEYFFFNESPAQGVIRIVSGGGSASLFGYIEFSLFYALFSVWLLFPIYFFKIRSFWALYLAAGFFGIATEGVVIPLIYTESLIWPALSWHVLADVILGWYLVRLLLTKNEPFYTIPLAVAMGLFWAFWAPWTHVGADPFIPEPAQFTGFVLFTSLGALGGYFILNLVRQKEFKPTGLEFGVFGCLTLVLWIPMLIGAWLPMIGAKPVNSFLLPVYLGVSLYTLHRHGRLETRENLLAVVRPEIAWWNFLLMALMPVTAIIAYPFFYRHGFFPPTGFIVLSINTSACILTPLAVLMLWRNILTPT